MLVIPSTLIILGILIHIWGEVLQSLKPKSFSSLKPLSVSVPLQLKVNALGPNSWYDAKETGNNIHSMNLTTCKFAPNTKAGPGTTLYTVHSLFVCGEWDNARKGLLFLHGVNGPTDLLPGVPAVIWGPAVPLSSDL